MVDFSTGVAVPPTSAYGPPQVDFSQLGNLVTDFQNAGLSEQQKKLNQQRSQQLQQQLDLATTFSGGLPTDAQGNPDYRKITAMLAQKGGINQIGELAPYVQVQQAGGLSPLFGAPGGAPPGGSPGAPPGAPDAAPAPAPSPARMPTRSGGDQPGSVVSVVSTQLPEQAPQTGAVIARIAQALGVDPNQQLTVGQTVRAQGLLRRWAGAAGQPAGGSGAPPPAAPGAAPQPAGDSAVPNARVADSFNALPPSAGNVTPAAASNPQRVPQPAPAAQPGQGPVPQAGQPQPGAPQQQSQQPLTPQVPLPIDPRTGKRFTDPQEAIQAIEAEVARLSTNPANRGQIGVLQNWAERIQASTAPIAMRSGEVLIDPRTKQPIYQAPSSNASNVALQRFLAEYPDATPQQIQAFVQSGRSGRSALAMYMNKYLQENPDATADEVKTAAQTYQTQTTAQNRFMSGPQGNTIRSLNVVVSHLGTLQNLGTALQNGDIRLFNQIAQRFAEETGSAAPTNLDTAKQIVGAEIIKSLGVAGAGTQTERQEAADAVNRARSPQQIMGAIRDVVRPLLIGQLKGLRRQFVTSTGLAGTRFDDMLEPETRSFFGSEEESGTRPSGQGGAPSGNVVRWERKPDGSLGPVQ